MKKGIIVAILLSIQASASFAAEYSKDGFLLSPYWPKDQRPDPPIKLPEYKYSKDGFLLSPYWPKVIINPDQ